MPIPWWVKGVLQTTCFQNMIVFRFIIQFQSNLTYKWQFNNTLETVVELPVISFINTENGGGLVIVNGGGSMEEGVPYSQPLHSASSAATAKAKHQQGNNLLVEKQQQHSGKTNRHYHHHRTQQKIREENLSSGKTYPYKIESFSHFGTVTCYAENPYGHSGPCYYHILAAGGYRLCSAAERDLWR